MDANPPVETHKPSATSLDGYRTALDSEANEAALKNFFTYHPPTDEDIQHYSAVNDAALALARVIITHCPPSPDRSTAIRKVREARMDANASIACLGAKLPY